GSFQVDSLCENNEKKDHFSGDPNANKVRFKDATSNIEDVMDVDSTPTPTLSWKDMVLGKGSTSTYGERVSSAANEACSQLEGDVKNLIVNGILAIDFSNRVKKLLVKDMSTFVILNLLGRNIGFTTLQNKGPWIIFEQYLTVQPWTIYFTSTSSYPNNVLAWIRLPGLPSHLYKKKEVLWEIEGMVGKVTKLDFNTEGKTRGHYARMSGSRVDGHSKDGCPHIQETENNSGEITLTIENPRIDVDLVTKNSDFGHWLLVERRSRCNLCEQSKHGKIGEGEKLSGSRFHALSLNSNFFWSDLGKGERHSTMEINGKKIAKEDIGKLPLRGKEPEVGNRESLLEPRVSDLKANTIIAKLGLDRTHWMESVGFSDGIWLGRKETSINVKVHDLGFRGSLFTWNSGYLFEHLDWALGNKAWLEAF
ncbi:hypothetical protein Golax_026021, partial [Gossypium laxum]|nr:hypothetical protein [Gossypium laxum]